MKKILFCLLVLFLVGCVPLQPIEEIKEEGPEALEGVVEEGTGFVKEIIANEYKITPPGSITVDGKKMEVLEITSDYEIKIKVGDTDYVIYKTNKQEIVNNIELIAKEIKFDPTSKNTYVILKATKYVSKENEYVLYINDEITVANHKIVLINVDTDTLQSIQIRVDNKDARINKGKSATLNNLEITNINTNPRAVSSEKYAIIKVISLL